MSHTHTLMFENLTDRISFVVSGISPYHRHQYLCHKADKFLSKVLPDIVRFTKMGIRSSLNGGTEVTKLTLRAEFNDIEYSNILIERLESCDFTVEIYWVGPHLSKTLEVSF